MGLYFFSITFVCFVLFCFFVFCCCVCVQNLNIRLVVNRFKGLSLSHSIEKVFLHTHLNTFAFSLALALLSQWSLSDTLLIKQFCQSSISLHSIFKHVMRWISHVFGLRVCDGSFSPRLCCFFVGIIRCILHLQLSLTMSQPPFLRLLRSLLCSQLQCSATFFRFSASVLFGYHGHQ